jgi:AcrR family transcriptional regulator
MARTRTSRQLATGSSLSTADRLLAGAADLFRRQGYAGTTTRELSSILGIQNASLYYHMEKKEDLLYRLCLATLNDVAAELKAVETEQDPLQRLGEMMRAYVTRVLLDRDRHAAMLLELRALSKGRRQEVVKLRDKNVAFVRDTFVEAQRRGQIRADIPAKFLTLAMFNLANWSIFWFRPDGELSATRIAHILHAIFMEGVATNDDLKRRSLPKAVASHRRARTK